MARQQSRAGTLGCGLHRHSQILLLTQKLEELFAEAADLEKTIRDNLKGLCYGNE